jgi:hypothetical protein
MVRILRQRGRSRIWVALATIALLASVVAVLPALASHPGTTDGIQPVKLPTSGASAGGYVNCQSAEAFEGLPAGTTRAFSFHSNPSQAKGSTLTLDLILHPEGTVVSGWSVSLFVANDGRSFRFEVLNGSTVVEDDGNLEAPRKTHNRSENLSHVTFCFAQVNGGYILAFVEVKGSEGTNHYAYADPLNCGETVTTSDGDVSGSFTRLSNREGITCQPKLYALFASDAENQVGFLPEGDQPATYRGVLTFNPQPKANPPAHTIEYDPGTGFKDMQWCTSVTRDGQGNVTGGVMPGTESWCIVDLLVKIYDAANTQPTWTVLGFDDPLVRGR